MKLIYYINRNLSLLIFLLLGIWGMFFYYTIIDEVMDETDDTLLNYRDIMVGKILADPSILKTEDNILHSYTLRRIAEEEAENYKEVFYDSTVYIETEDEFEPVRIMKSCFMASDFNYYELELRLSTLERDDLIHAIYWYLLALYIIIIMCTMMGTRILLRKMLRPLDRLLKWLGEVSPDRPAPPLDNHTNIHEFSTLNQAAIDMQCRSEKAYQEQKQFIENASHELQTPLAIIRGKLELLSENENLTEKDFENLEDIYNSLNRAVQLNKSLLLLSRINNGQFPETTSVNITENVKKSIELISEIYESKNLQYHVSLQNDLIMQMNESLSHILINNLIKNSIVHTLNHGNIYIDIQKNILSISNDGQESLNKERMFTRFYKDKSAHNESIGLGLSIVHSIANLYNIELKYSFDNGRHFFVLKFPKV